MRAGEAGAQGFKLLAIGCWRLEGGIRCWGLVVSDLTLEIEDLGVLEEDVLQRGDGDVFGPEVVFERGFLASRGFEGSCTRDGDLTVACLLIAC